MLNPKKGLNKSQETIIKLIRNNPNITIPQIMIETNLAAVSVKKNLKILKDYKIVERVGSNNGGYWKINE